MISSTPCIAARILSSARTIADYAWGGKGDDRIDGRGGNDSINGEGGDDRMTGGGGVRLFLLHAGRQGAARTSSPISTPKAAATSRTILPAVSTRSCRSSRSGDDLVLDYGGGNTLTLLDVDKADFQRRRFRLRGLMHHRPPRPRRLSAGAGPVVMPPSERPSSVAAAFSAKTLACSASSARLSSALSSVVPSLTRRWPWLARICQAKSAQSAGCLRPWSAASSRPTGPTSPGRSWQARASASSRTARRWRAPRTISPSLPNKPGSSRRKQLPLMKALGGWHDHRPCPGRKAPGPRRAVMHQTTKAKSSPLKIGLVDVEQGQRVAAAVIQHKVVADLLDRQDLVDTAGNIVLLVAAAFGVEIGDDVRAAPCRPA
ncbi:MAG: hypothetical protein KL863_25930 [Rhizobium sp.]|nr:hypothetical protein [Rhizobium sp.]